MNQKMKYKAIYFKRHILSLKNVIMLIIFILISLGLIFSISLVITFNDLKNTIQKYNIGFRTIVVRNELDNYDTLNDIEHIVAIEDAIYKGEVGGEVKEFDSDLKGYLTLRALLDSNSIDIVYGRNLENPGEAICNNIFYPYNLTVVDNQFQLYKNKIIAPEDAINKVFTINSYNNENENKKFKIVGFYNSQKNENTLNTCYILKEDYIEIAPPYEGAIISYDEAGNEVIKPIEYKGKVIIVDNVENVGTVKKSLNDLNYSYYTYSEIDENFMRIVTYLPIFVGIILIIIIIWLVNLFVKKKINDKNKTYAILKITGCIDDEIIKIDVIENVIISTIAFIVGIILYIVLFEILKYKYLIDYIYQGVNITFSSLSILIAFVIIELLVIVVNKRTLKKRLSNTINQIIGSV